MRLIVEIIEPYHGRIFDPASGSGGMFVQSARFVEEHRNGNNGSEVRALLADGLGSVRVEMVGTVVETATTHTPYGEVLEQTGTSGTAYGFTGEQEDSATGLLNLRVRYYNSSLKSFQSRDPWEGTGWRPNTLDNYLYGRQNPVNLVDPSRFLYCRASKPGCADWLVDMLERIRDNPGPVGTFLVNTLWSKKVYAAMGAISSPFYSDASRATLT